MSISLPPSLSIILSLSPQTYTFTNPTPPTISLSITSHSPRPLTLFAWRTPLSPRIGLTQAHFPITDITNLQNPVSIPQTTIRLQRTPFSRARGSADEKYFLTLSPETPVIVSCGFSRGGGERGVRPQPKEVVEKGWELDERGKKMRVRRSTKGCGIDGLEKGHRYKVDVKREVVEQACWLWGDKEEILVEKGSKDWGLAGLEWERGRLEVEEIEGVEFEVV